MKPVACEVAPLGAVIDTEDEEPQSCMRWFPSMFSKSSQAANFTATEIEEKQSCSDWLYSIFYPQNCQDSSPSSSPNTLRLDDRRTEVSTTLSNEPAPGGDGVRTALSASIMYAGKGLG